MKPVVCVGCRRTVLLRTDGTCRLCDTKNRVEKRRGNKHGARQVWHCHHCGIATTVRRDKPRAPYVCTGCGKPAQRFDSVGEYRRWMTLRELQEHGGIRFLQCQTPFPIVINGVQVGKYIADFTYQNAAGKEVIEDYKGQDTPLSKFKRKCVEAQHGITIQIIRKEHGRHGSNKRRAERKPHPDS